MKDMRLGDQAFFYHSNCKDPGIAGLVEVMVLSHIEILDGGLSNLSFLLVDCTRGLCGSHTVRQKRPPL